jgi:hypothetical protein
MIAAKTSKLYQGLRKRELHPDAATETQPMRSKPANDKPLLISSMKPKQVTTRTKYIISNNPTIGRENHVSSPQRAQRQAETPTVRLNLPAPIQGRTICNDVH